MVTNEPKPGRTRSILAGLFSKENALALALCFIVIALIVMTSSSAPQWIYQGF